MLIKTGPDAASKQFFQRIGPYLIVGVEEIHPYYLPNTMGFLFRTLVESSIFLKHNAGSLFIVPRYTRCGISFLSDPASLLLFI